MSQSKTDENIYLYAFLQSLVPQNIFRIGVKDESVLINVKGKLLSFPFSVIWHAKLNENFVLDLIYADISIPKLLCDPTNLDNNLINEIKLLEKFQETVPLSNEFISLIKNDNRNINYIFSSELPRFFTNNIFTSNSCNYTIEGVSLEFYFYGIYDDKTKNTSQQSLKSCPKDPSIIWSNDSVSIIITGPGNVTENKESSQNVKNTEFIQYEDVLKFTQLINPSNKIVWFNCYSVRTGSKKANISKAIKYAESDYSFLVNTLSADLDERTKFNSEVIISAITSTLQHAYDCCRYLSNNNHLVIESSVEFGVSVTIGSMTKLLYDPFYSTFDGFLKLIYTDWINNGLFYENVTHNRILFYIWLLCVRALHYYLYDFFQFSSSLIDYIIKHLWTNTFFPFSSLMTQKNLFENIKASKNKFFTPIPKKAYPLYKLLNKFYKTDENLPRIPDLVTKIEKIFSCLPIIDKYLDKDMILDKKYLCIVEEFYHDPDAPNEFDSNSQTNNGLNPLLPLISDPQSTSCSNTQIADGSINKTTIGSNTQDTNVAVITPTLASVTLTSNDPDNQTNTGSDLKNNNDI